MTLNLPKAWYEAQAKREKKFGDVSAGVTGRVKKSNESPAKKTTRARVITKPVSVARRKNKSQ